MAISDNQKLDYLFKKVGFGATKTDTNANKLAANESLPSPLLIRGDTIWAESGSIPAVKPSTTTSPVTIQTAIECTPDITATTNRTWKTGITDWIPTEFGATYLVNVYIHDSNDSAGAESLSNKVFTTGSGNNDEWFFDYQSGVLNFIGENLPNGKSFTGKSVYISGATYSGTRGTASSSVTADISTLQTQVANIISNTDPAALDSLTEIVNSIPSLTVEEINDPSSNVSVSNVEGLKFNVNSGFVLTDNSDGTVTIDAVNVSDLLDLGITDGTSGQVLSTDGNGNFSFTDNASGLLDLNIADGTAGQVLQTDGNGNFSFTDNSIQSSPIPTSQEFTGDGTTVDYTLTDTPADEESIDVYVNDVLQRPSIYSLSGTTLTFNTTPASGDNIYVKYRYPNATNVSLVNNSVENRHLDLIYTSNQYTGNGSTQQFTIESGHTVHDVLVIVDGLILPPTEYTIGFGNTLTITNAPANSAVIDIRYLPV